MQAAEIRRRQKEEQELQRLYQLQEERRMQEELTKKRMEQEVGLTLYLWTLNKHVLLYFELSANLDKTKYLYIKLLAATNFLVHSIVLALHGHIVTQHLRLLFTPRR